VRDWDDLAQCIRMQLPARRVSSPADAGDEKDELLDSIPFSSLVQLAVSSTDPAALSMLLGKVGTMAGPAAASNDTGYQQGPELEQLLADRQQPGSHTSSSACPGRIHIYARTSSYETDGTVSASVNDQTVAIAAAVAQLLRLCTGLPVIMLWQESCSVYHHRPADRTVLQRMLEQLQPGDAVVVASPDRLARNEADFCCIVQQLRAKHTALLAVAIGRHALLPLVLLDDGGQALYAAGSPLQPEEEQQQQQDDDEDSTASAEPGACSVAELLQHVLPTVCRLLQTVGWATSAHQSSVVGQHGFMAGQLKTTAACGAVSSILRALLTPVATYFFTRVSQCRPQGAVGGMVGGLALSDMDAQSLARQHQFCALATG